MEFRGRPPGPALLTTVRKQQGARGGGFFRQSTSRGPAGGGGRVGEHGRRERRRVDGVASGRARHPDGAAPPGHPQHQRPLHPTKVRRRRRLGPPEARTEL